MNQVSTIEDFYRKHLISIPDNLKKEMGHFNVFKRDEFVGPNARPVPYTRKDFFKISLLKGRNRIHYADKTVLSEKYALLFGNPMIPYNWEAEGEEQSGYFCIFTEAFFDHFGSFRDYPVFKPGQDKVFVLPEEKLEEVEAVFLRMFDEIASDYAYKYDVLRNLVFELVHTALKMRPAEGIRQPESTASVRISSLFAELLERQFPVESTDRRVLLKSPGDFATHLSVHVNHLNRSLKEVSGKTTSQLIADRVLREAQVLLRHTDWNISEISYSLGFEELSHFNHFFRKNARITPGRYRKETPV